MKTMKMKTVSLLWVLGFLLISIIGNSQNPKLSRQEKKEVRKAQLDANFYILDSLLKAQSFVLEADFLQNSYGYRIPVVSNLSFVKVDGSKGILQTGSDSNIGYNGVGGVTAEGSVGNWKIFTDYKHQSYRLQFNLNSIIGIYDISMTVSADNNATATISGLGPGKLTWQGHLATVDNSRVFKGQETY
jgi:hypothetical protein